MSLSKENFIEAAEENIEAQKIYFEIHDKLTKNKDYNQIFISCYLCGHEGHISVNCDKYDNIKGNLNKHIFKIN